MASSVILALDCSTEFCSVALLNGDVMTAKEIRADQRHSELLLPMIDAVLIEGGIGLNQLSVIAFGAGPGSFTGLRIACGVAQGLAFGANISVLPIPTLLALAQASDHARVLAVLDARMGEVYVAAYERVDGPWRAVIEPCLCKPDAAPPLPHGAWTGVGSGFAAYADVLQRQFGAQLTSVDASRFPQARYIAQLASERLLEALPAENAVPLYIRDKVAFTERERGVGK